MRTDSFAPENFARASAPLGTLPAAEPGISGDLPTSRVGQPLNARARAKAITRAGNAADAHWQEFELTGCDKSLQAAERADSLLLQLRGIAVEA